MNTRTATRIEGCDGDGYTTEEHRIVGLWLKARRMRPGDRGLLLPERHPAIVERNRPLMTTIGERLVMV